MFCFEFPGKKKVQVEFSHLKVFPPRSYLKLWHRPQLVSLNCLPSLGTSSHQMVMGNGKTREELAMSNPGSFLKWT